ncbi:MAG: hypothetical protein M3295_01690 [Chloroflexota bacterium]|nr:hypothetical protein [Chloroflexota bacterium]
MALVAPLLAFVGRFVGKIVTVAFGWATTLLFGQVPQSKQLLLAGISLASIAWLATVVGVLFPAVGSLLIAAVPAPDWIDDAWIRLAMLIGAIILPILIGIGGFFAVDADDRPSGFGIVTQVLRGYPYAAVLALTLLLLLVVAPIRKVRSIVRRWEDAHIPMVVKPGGYDRVADDLEGAVDATGLDIRRAGAPRILEAPSKLLAAVGGAGVRRLVPDRLFVLKNPALEVMIHPSDISISGRKTELARARAAIASRLTFTAAYLTTTRESQELEERLEAVSRRMASMPDEPAANSVASERAFSEVEQELHEVDAALDTLEIGHDDWEVLYRQRLQVERDVMRKRLAAVSPASDDATGRDEHAKGPIDRVADAVRNLVSS